MDRLQILHHRVFRDICGDSRGNPLLQTLDVNKPHGPRTLAHRNQGIFSVQGLAETDPADGVFLGGHLGDGFLEGVFLGLDGLHAELQSAQLDDGALGQGERTGGWRRSGVADHKPQGVDVGGDQGVVCGVVTNCHQGLVIEVT